MKSRVVVRIKVTGGWEWLLATIMLPDRVNRGWKADPTIKNRLS
jgi:hypothetical protein